MCLSAALVLVCLPGCWPVVQFSFIFTTAAFCGTFKSKMFFMLFVLMDIFESYLPLLAFMLTWSNKKKQLQWTVR